jgi:hypothetical protein
MVQQLLQQTNRIFYSCFSCNFTLLLLCIQRDSFDISNIQNETKTNNSNMHIKSFIYEPVTTQLITLTQLKTPHLIDVSMLETEDFAAHT